jgi:DNA-binding winged helix-turn-helix (wHTH) protein
MPVQEAAVSAYAFGPFVLHLRDRVLYRTGLPLEINAKVFDILRCLVQYSDRLVTKDLLVDEVWGGSPIGDNNITQHIHLVREVLGDLAKPYHYIATVHGRGYRLITPPVALPGHDGSLQSGTPSDLLAQSLAAELCANAAFFMTMGTPAALESSAQLCRKALQVQPGYAEAHAGIALGAMLKAAFLFSVPLQEFDVARRHASTALRLEPRCAHAHVVMAALALLDDLAPGAAHKHLEAAESALPDLIEIAIIRILAFSAQGEHTAARHYAAQAVNQHASSTALAAYSAFAAYLGGDVEFARGALERLLIFKAGAAFPTYLLGLTCLVQGHYAQARAAFETLLAGRISLLPSYEKFRLRAIGALAYIEARTGSRDDARALAKDVQRNPHCSYVALAMARAGAGEEDSVIACLERARLQRDPWFPLVRHDPVFADYRDLPEFQRIVGPEPAEGMKF